MEELIRKNNLDFKDIKFYEQAFVHRSFINENPNFDLGHNERLEFLGDAVLELIVTDFLYHKYPGHSEGDLTSYRAALVNTNTISEVAFNLDFNSYLKLSKGESKDGGRARHSILADTYEAFIGAIYLDSGYEACKRFVTANLLEPYTDRIVEEGLFKDAKSLIQEKSQEKYGLTPVYKVINESGPDHDKVFEVGIYFGDDLIAVGNGKSKQNAEADSAKNGLIKKGWIKA